VQLEPAELPRRLVRHRTWAPVAAPTLRSAVASAAAQRPARRSRLAISLARRHTRFSVAQRLLAAHQHSLGVRRRLEQRERPAVQRLVPCPGIRIRVFLGAGALTLGSILGDTQIANANSNLAHDYMALGAPSRQRYEDSFNPNFDVSRITGLQQAMDTSYQGLLHGLSTQGNPYGKPERTERGAEKHHRQSHPADAPELP
jgi:hypothetical protein